VIHRAPRPATFIAHSLDRIMSNILVADGHNNVTDAPISL
jgi:hypothetical protein